jgi:hypothetical protein
MARNIQKQLIRVQAQTFSDWCAEVRELAGQRWPMSRTNARRSTPSGAAARHPRRRSTW